MHRVKNGTLTMRTFIMSSTTQVEMLPSLRTKIGDALQWQQQSQLDAQWNFPGTPKSSCGPLDCERNACSIQLIFQNQSHQLGIRCETHTLVAVPQGSFQCGTPIRDWHLHCKKSETRNHTLQIRNYSNEKFIIMHWMKQQQMSMHHQQTLSSLHNQ